MNKAKLFSYYVKIIVIMIKDLFIAIILGAVLGIAATGGVVTIKNSKSKNIISVTPTPVISVSPQEVAKEDSKQEADISIISPLNESVITTSKTKIEGVTKANSVVIIKNIIDTINTTSDSAGHFESEINLESGVNHILISAFDSQDNQYDSQLIVTYSTAKF